MYWPIGYYVDRDAQDIELLLHLYETEILAWRYSANHHLHLIVSDFHLARELSDVNWFTHCLERNSFNLANESSFFCEKCNHFVTLFAGPWVILQNKSPWLATDFQSEKLEERKCHCQR